MAVNKMTVIKCVELIVAVMLCLQHIDAVYIGKPFNDMIVTGTFFGSTIILVGALYGIYVGAPLSPQMDKFYTATGAVLYIVATWILYSHYFRSNYSLFNNASEFRPFFSLLNGILFVVDTVFACYK